MKTIVFALLVGASSQVFALSKFKCEVSEDVAPPLESRSVNYVLTAQLNKDSQARIDADGQILNLKYGFETFTDTEGKQIVMIGANANGQYSTAYGNNSAALFYDVPSQGELFAHCFVENERNDKRLVPSQIGDLRCTWDELAGGCWNHQGRCNCPGT